MDNELIKKAIELADGFEAEGSWSFSVMGRSSYPFNERFTANDDPAQWFLDALAAQLVRQVDALRDPTVGVITSDLGSISIWRNRQKLATSINEDRTLNRIKAIVDSGVLNGD